MKKGLLCWCVFLFVPLISMAQSMLHIRSKGDPCAIQVSLNELKSIAYTDDSLTITRNHGEEVFSSLYYHIQHIAITDQQLSNTSFYDTICAGETYTWHGNIYTRPGTYTDTLQNIHGCDSIVTLHLEVLPDPPITFTVNGVNFKMMRVRAGTFIMGATADDTNAEADEFPRHEVTLTKDYFIAETEMTQALWQAIMGNNPSEDKSNPQSPVNNVSWDDCQEMIAKLNDLTGLTFRLPTEAEWEYAARAGYYSRGYIYAGSNNIDEVAWYNKPHYASVASLKPNELGLYDMSGSVYEWCQDWYDPKSYSYPDHRIDPFQEESVDGRRCLRGGSNKMDQGIQAKKYSRIANRGQNVINYRTNSVGLRLALEATGIMENNREFVTYDTICAGETITWNGKTYSKPGAYTDTLQNIHGCDSIVTLHLQVNPTYEIHDTIVVCGSYLFNPFSKNEEGIILYESGTYKDTVASISGCDSVFVLHLTINNSIEVPYTVTACDSYTWSNGVTYTESGIYYDSLKTIHGCDSVEVLTLTINYRDTAFFAETACDSYEWHGKEYTTSGTYYYHTQTVLGCDSVEVLTLDIKYTSYFAYDTIVCGSYLFAGEELTESGEYTYTTVAANGCDSITTLHLTVHPITPTQYVYDTICSDDLPYIFNDSIYNTTGSYTQYYLNQYGCDSNIVLNLHVVDKLIVEVDSLPNLCADDQILRIHYDVLQGEFDSLHIRFLNDILPAAFYPKTIYKGDVSDIVYPFDSTTWVDHYTIQMEFYQHHACGNQVFELPFDIQYSASIIVQKWNIFLALQNAKYNGGYTFTNYQWYKNDLPIEGATRASLHQMLDTAANYYALLTRDDGVVMRTCDFLPTYQYGFPEFPTLVKASQTIYVANTVYSAPVESIEIYSAVGQQISTNHLIDGEGNVQMPSIAGNYIVKIRTKDDQIISQLLIVLW